MKLCKKCGEAEVWVDGIHCIDCWPGYDNCADPRCQHYRCEHDLHLGKAIYVKPGCEEEAKKFDGLEYSGCWNADCPCDGFKE